jgi:23S rRNA pseudouridine2605 synthase
MTDQEPELDTELRLQKVLAKAGIGSRRRCEQLIEEGRVSVNGHIVEEQGLRIDPATAVVHVDGKRIPTAPDNIVLVMNKPRGVITTMEDEQGRRCVGDLVSDRPERLFHIGRLDADTEGLLLLTNDGELANRVGHPSHGVDKTYVATVEGTVTQHTLRILKSGVELEDGPMKVDAIRIIQQAKDRAMVELVIHEGRNRIVRRLMNDVGHPVIDLVRTRIGPLHLGNLKGGQVQELVGSDLHALYTAVGL